MVACTKGAIRAFDLETGEMLWERAGTPIVTSPLLTADGLLVAEPAALVLLDPASGTELRRRTLDADIEVREILVTQEGIYILTPTYELIAVR